MPWYLSFSRRLLRLPFCISRYLSSSSPAPLKASPPLVESPFASQHQRRAANVPQLYLCVFAFARAADNTPIGTQLGTHDWRALVSRQRGQQGTPHRNGKIAKSAESACRRDDGGGSWRGEQEAGDGSRFAGAVACLVRCALTSFAAHCVSPSLSFGLVLSPFV